MAVFSSGHSNAISVFILLFVTGINSTPNKKTVAKDVEEKYNKLLSTIANMNEKRLNALKDYIELDSYKAGDGYLRQDSKNADKLVVLTEDITRDLIYDTLYETICKGGISPELIKYKEALFKVTKLSNKEESRPLNSYTTKGVINEILREMICKNNRRLPNKLGIARYGNPNQNLEELKSNLLDYLQAKIEMLLSDMSEIRNLNDFKTMKSEKYRAGDRILRQEQSKGDVSRDIIYNSLYDAICKDGMTPEALMYKEALFNPTNENDEIRPLNDRLTKAIINEVLHDMICSNYRRLPKKLRTARHENPNYSREEALESNLIDYLRARMESRLPDIREMRNLKAIKKYMKSDKYAAGSAILKETGENNTDLDDIIIVNDGNTKVIIEEILRDMICNKNGEAPVLRDYREVVLRAAKKRILNNALIEDDKNKNIINDILRDIICKKGKKRKTPRSEPRTAWLRHRNHLMADYNNGHNEFNNQRSKKYQIDLVYSKENNDNRVDENEDKNSDGSQDSDSDDEDTSDDDEDRKDKETEHQNDDRFDDGNDEMTNGKNRERLFDEIDDDKEHLRARCSRKGRNCKEACKDAADDICDEYACSGTFKRDFRARCKEYCDDY